MDIFAKILTLYTWVVVCVLLFFMFSIARFFEKRLTQKAASENHRPHYPFFIAPLVLFALGGIVYVFSPNSVVGNPLADLIHVVASGILIWASYVLLQTMTGGKS